ncbi:Sec-independent protein translocase subunit TatA [Streptomyces sp. NPDC026673]|uniref:Sec-independent protein translocase subunit TatA n=1 Tax=Streptomyces sp. NPDC026673 TaxID=3155724 RepID=UPI0033F2A279
MFGRLGAPEIILILVVVLLLFGAKRLPDMARSFGQSLRILKSETKAMRKDDEDGTPSGTHAATVLEPGPESLRTATEAAAAEATHRR